MVGGGNENAYGRQYGVVAADIGRELRAYSSGVLLAVVRGTPDKRSKSMGEARPSLQRRDYRDSRQQWDRR